MSLLQAWSLCRHFDSTWYADNCTLQPFSDGAIFNSRIADNLPRLVTAAAVKGGLPSTSIGRLLDDLINSKTDDLAKIPGITPEIIKVSGQAVKTAYLNSMHAVWYASSAVAAVGLVRKSI